MRLALRGARDPAPLAGQRNRAARGPGDVHTRKVLDLTTRLAQVMLSSGSGTADVIATAQDVARAYRINDCIVDIFSNTILVSAPPTADGAPVTIVRTVHARSTDYTRLTELDRLVQRITTGEIDVDRAHEVMDDLTTRPHPYPRWLATVGWAGFALGIAMLLGGTWLTCLLAALSSALIDRVGRILNRRGTPFFFQNAAGAAIATVIAVGAYLVTGQGPTELVAAGIVVLLSGLTLVGAMQDAVTNHIMTATARFSEAVLLTSGIVVGILAGLQMATAAGVTIVLHVEATESFVATFSTVQMAVAVLGAALAGSCLTVASYAPWRSVLNAGLAAGLAELVVIGLGRAGFGHIFACGIAAVGVGVVATLISVRRQAPALVVATAGIMPMLPGLAVFRAVFSFAVDGNYANGVHYMLTAVATALALGSGVVLGELLGAPLRSRASRLGALIRKDGPPGLRRVVARRAASDTRRPPGPDLSSPR